ncbi:MAG: phosphomannose isomerase type II C-terminal cupin domain [Gammaproteobacteria bacterium]|nr:phosphomannose isomerase type II C-terminal cupin domain [Gammaproteobacteria bacterium]
MIKIEKPWGNYISLYEGDLPYDKIQIKTLTVLSGQRLSLQSHKHRKEYWLVVSGNPTIEVEQSERDYFIGDLIKILPNQRHRLSNQYTDPVVVVEVQTGPYLGEDDIIRYEDDYNRDDVEEMQNIIRQTKEQSGEE